MPITTPIPIDVLDKYSLSQLLRAIITRAVDGTVVPLFVDPIAGKVLIGTVVSTGNEILQVNGDAKITGLLKTGSLFTTGISSPGCVWAGSLVANGNLRCGSLIVAGPTIFSGPVQSLTLTTADGKHTGRVCLDDPDSTGAMGLRVDAFT